LRLKQPDLSATVYLVTPPFTQLNTPYPATAYLKGFLNTKNIRSFQSDLGIEVTTRIFCQTGLTEIFDRIGKTGQKFSANSERIIGLKELYLQTIDSVILFLQGKNPTLAHLIAKRDFLPEASRFSQLDDLHWAFGTMGINDKAKHLATMYLEDLSDLIQECLDSHFGFSRYAEKLGRSANSFDELYNALAEPRTFVDEIMISLLQARITEVRPSLVAMSVPFPGNLYAALRCGQWIKSNHPHIKVAMGGGFPNTELRSLKDTRVFEFVDFITLDDGEAPVENLIGYVEGTKTFRDLKRTFLLADGRVQYLNESVCADYKQSEVGTPDYSDFFLDQYISAIEVVNPMHRLWSDGRWNKLTMAHGCYWGKCTFCDISLDYIKLYEPVAAKLLCDRMEQMIKQTGQNGFHFVDEAAPPALMRALAMEIMRRKLVVSWWTNVRFEKSFTRDLCQLLSMSGCIAVSGGLEVASDRLLELIQKGITVAQVARVTKNLTDAGIMVHAYLMYGFPTQTAQETIDSLEMVRQLFKLGILQSAFWHQFTMTAHSPVGLEPEKYMVTRESVLPGNFANNDLVHDDPTGTDHAQFSFGLKKSLFNFMHGIKLDDPVHKWFDFKAPKSSVAPDYIANALNDDEVLNFRPNAKVIWLGKLAGSEHFIQSKKGNQREMISLHFDTRKQSQSIQLPREQGEWFSDILSKLTLSGNRIYTMQELKESFEAKGFDDFELFWFNKPVSGMNKLGLLRL
jgi:hypothetical protein